jgi:hypothetical protein
MEKYDAKCPCLFLLTIQHQSVVKQYLAYEETHGGPGVRYENPVALREKLYHGMWLSLLAERPIGKKCEPEQWLRSVQ